MSLSSVTPSAVLVKITLYTLQHQPVISPCNAHHLQIKNAFNTFSIDSNVWSLQAATSSQFLVSWPTAERKNHQLVSTQSLCFQLLPPKIPVFTEPISFASENVSSSPAVHLATGVWVHLSPSLQNVPPVRLLEGNHNGGLAFESVRWLHKKAQKAFISPWQQNNLAPKEC